MSPLDPNAVATVADYMRGKRREKFLASVAILNDSAALGAWSIPRARIKAGAGFYQGIAKVPYHAGKLEFALGQCFNYGHARGLTVDDLWLDLWLKTAAPKLPYLVARAWIACCNAARALIVQLDAARPRPVVTPIGLSPKVTKTLTECNLDLELPSIKPAKVEPFEVQDRDEKTRRPLWNADGSPKMVTMYRVVWSPGIKHNQSRFAHGGCEACGKRIPSGRYVPIEATCRRNGLVSMWLGCDCARNIFGIKDVGLARSSEK